MKGMAGIKIPDGKQVQDSHPEQIRKEENIEAAGVILRSKELAVIHHSKK
jgi:hypothetical protein